MALVLARFLFGLALTLAGALLLVCAAWLCLRLIRLVIRTLPDDRSQDAANGIGVLAIMTLALWAIHACGDALYTALGNSPLVGTTGTTPGWLAGGHALSASAVLGAIVAVGLLAWMPALWRPREPREAAPAAPPPDPAPRRRPADAAPRGPRRPLLCALALFLLAIGGVLLLFAHIVAPWGMADGIPGAAPMLERAWPIYLAAFGLLAGGLAVLLLWWFWRGAAPAAAKTPNRRG
ncbi:hypothetical protein [Bordetella sp. 2513F-2]